MGQVSGVASPAAVAAKKQLSFQFKRRGIITATLSGMFYGTYTAFMTLAMLKGIWAVWYGEGSGLNEFAVLFLLSALGAATTDTCSALWALGIAGFKGKLGDFVRCLKTKPGLIMVGAALVGGPLASTAYVIGLQKAGPIVVPISALCPAIGAILSRILFKGQLNARMMLGIVICFSASAMIGSTGLGDNVPDGLVVGLLFGLLAAVGWGLEGCVGGYSVSMVDPEIGITIRQVTSSLSNMFILVPIFAIIAGVNPVTMVTTALTDFTSMKFFILAGLGAYFGFMLWYKGNAMCGAALGMSCNGAFSFWGPFCCWLIIGLIFKEPGDWALPPIAWAAAIVMIIGIFTIAMNPWDLFRKKEEDAA